MAHSFAAALAIPGGQNPRICSKEMYKNLGLEISSLPYDAKREKVLEFLRRHANCHVHLTDLCNEIKFISLPTLSRWLKEFRGSAEVQPLVTALAAQGMASNNFRQAIGGSHILGQARRLSQPCEVATGGGPVYSAGGRPCIVHVTPGICFQSAPSHPATPSNPVS
jgi:hypothetical protein